MKKVIVAVAIILILAAGTALAATPVGQWSYRAFNAPDLDVGPLQGICFVADGTWYSTTFSGWSGKWYQNGDRIRFYGRTGILSTAEFGQFFSNTKFSGEFAHFKPSSPVSKTNVGNFLATMTSEICDAPASPAHAAESGDPAIE